MAPLNLGLPPSRGAVELLPTRKNRCRNNLQPSFESARHPERPSSFFYIKHGLIKNGMECALFPAKVFFGPSGLPKGVSKMNLIKKTASLAALIAIGSTASAASLSYDGALFTSTVTGGGSNYQLTMTMDFTGADPGNEFLGDMMESWSLTIGAPATLSLVSAPAPLAGWSLQNTAQADASGCGNGNVNSICVDWGDLNVLNGGGPLITDTSIFTFVVDLSFASPTDFLGDGNFHLLSVVESKCPGREEGPCYKKDGGLISQPLGTETKVPEPGSLALLGLGLLGLGMSRRRKV